MIISHKHKFIFLKNNKAAGSSIEMALSKFCGPDDVITKLIPEEDEQRASLGYRASQNYLIPESRYTLADRFRAFRSKQPLEFHGHIRARDLLKYIDRDIWDSYFKFCIVRSPWDRVASLHYYRARDGKRLTLKDSKVTQDKVLKRFNDQGWGLYTINDEIVVDMCCRFENLTDELEKARLKIGLPEPLELPNAKGTFRKKKGKVSQAELFSQEDIAKIRKYFRKEIETFGYDF